RRVLFRSANARGSVAREAGANNRPAIAAAPDASMRRRVGFSGEASKHRSHMNRIPLVRVRVAARGRAAALVSSCVALLALLLPAASIADEALRARVEALAVDPRVDDVAVADAWFLIRFYERRQFSPAWESDAKRDALLAALGRSVEHGLDPDDYHIARL